MIPTGDLSRRMPVIVKTKLRRRPYALFPLSAKEAETQPVDERSPLASETIGLDPPALLSMWNDQGRTASILGD